MSGFPLILQENDGVLDEKNFFVGAGFGLFGVWWDCGENVGLVREGCESCLVGTRSLDNRCWPE